MSNVQRLLAQSFHDQFIAQFVEECEPRKAAMLPSWQDKKAWTTFMLFPDSGFLPRLAAAWAKRTWNEGCILRNEWHKFDLMVLDSSGGKEWWHSTPLVTIEHENDNGIQDEVWKLSCWRSRLKVLVTYHDDDSQSASKRALAQQIIANIERDAESRPEWLLLSAPREWKGALDWQAHEWDGADWRLLSR